MSVRLIQRCPDSFGVPSFCFSFAVVGKHRAPVPNFKQRGRRGQIGRELASNSGIPVRQKLNLDDQRADWVDRDEF